MKNTITILLLSLMASCATTNQAPIRQTPKRKLSPEEQKRQAAIEHYRMLRLESIKKGTGPKTSKKKRYYKRVKPKQLPRVDESEQRVEIEQRLTYFCMENRHSRKFSKTGSCEEFTKYVYKNCNANYGLGDPRLTRCIKSGIK